jgi:predicted GIY-YIG superfamily endonuclease
MALCYLIHLHKPYKHARHYLGYTRNLPTRIKLHTAGAGARLMEVVTNAGIQWEVVRTWHGGRDMERKLKRRKNSPALCPLCKVRRKNGGNNV